MKKFILPLMTPFLLMACSPKTSVEWVTTTDGTPWEIQDPKTVGIASQESFDSEVDLDSPLQTIEGFGTCFNELGWTSLSLLSAEDRESVLRELFEPGVGANFTVCRMSVGANDFARDWYSYNETPGDFEMKHFSIENDRETLIPFIHNAQHYNPDIRIWASPWCPPVWMKNNGHYACSIPSSFFAKEFHTDIKPEQTGAEGTDMFNQNPKYMEAYALYFQKFIEAYRKEGIDIFMVMPQNEFNSCQPYPSCTWTVEGLHKFLRDHLGPRMTSIGVEVMFGTMERPDPKMVETILDDPATRIYISGAGFQWAGKYSIGAIHEKYPKLTLYQTEQECGNGANDWGFANYAWELMKHYFQNGVNVYEYWNTSLKKGGMSRWGWTQNSLVTVDPETRTFAYTNDYYLLKHFSHYVMPGAVMLPVSGEFDDLLAFRNPDGDIITVIRNDTDADTVKTIKVGGITLSPELKAKSFSTIRIPAKVVKSKNRK